MYLDVETGFGGEMEMSFDSLLRKRMKGITVKYPNRGYLCGWITEISLEKKWHMDRVQEEFLFYGGLLNFQSEGPQLNKIIGSHINSAWRWKLPDSDSEIILYCQIPTSLEARGR